MGASKDQGERVPEVDAYLAELAPERQRALAELSVGKSCVRFHKLEVLPLDSVRAILLGTRKQERSVKSR